MINRFTNSVSPSTIHPAVEGLYAPDAVLIPTFSAIIAPHKICYQKNSFAKLKFRNMPPSVTPISTAKRAPKKDQVFLLGFNIFFIPTYYSKEKEFFFYKHSNPAHFCAGLFCLIESKLNLLSTDEIFSFLRFRVPLEYMDPYFSLILFVSALPYFFLLFVIAVPIAAILVAWKWKSLNGAQRKSILVLMLLLIALWLFVMNSEYFRALIITGIF